MTKPKSSAAPMRHIPQRTCVGCNLTTAKRELVRIVCTQEGAAEVDLTGKKSGRGAYLCANKSCWEKAFKSGRLERVLKTKINAENIKTLVKYSEGFDNTNCNL